MLESIETNSHVTIIQENCALNTACRLRAHRRGQGRLQEELVKVQIVSIFPILVTHVGTWMLYILIPTFSNFCKIKKQGNLTFKFSFFMIYGIIGVLYCTQDSFEFLLLQAMIVLFP